VSYPNANLASTSCRIPVFGPQVHIYATGSVDSNVKNRIIKLASRKLRPKLRVPTMPKVILPST
jgi:hypothetical protein